MKLNILLLVCFLTVCCFEQASLPPGQPAQLPAREIPATGSFSEEPITKQVPALPDDPIESRDFQGRNAVLEQLLWEEQGAAQSLPPLREEFEETWLARLLNWVSRTAWGWLDALLASSVGTWDSALWQARLRYAFSWSVLVLVGVGIYYLLKALLARTALSQFREFAEKGMSAAKNLERHLSSEIKNALNAGDIPRATRLRWKLFLKRKGLSSDVTPYEFFGSFGTSGSALAPPPVQSFNRLMFGGQVAEMEHFHVVDQSLVQLEGPVLVEGSHSHA